MRIPLIPVLAVIVFACPDLAAQWEDPALPDPRGTYDWRGEAGKLGLDEADQQQLARQKVLMTNEAFRQVFAAYRVGNPFKGKRVPVFITSDSILNAYHVLLEESVYWLEWANAGTLPRCLSALLEAVNTLEVRSPGHPELASAARQRARLVLGVALTLLGLETPGIDGGLLGTVRSEVERITAARGLHRPTWLAAGKGSLVAIDYGRFRPQGFYTRSDRLARYFRSMRWLQAIPFRVEVEAELLSMLVLGVGLRRADGSGLEEILQFFRAFIGVGDDPDLLDAARVKGLTSEKPSRLILSPQRLRTIQAKMLEWFRSGLGPRINDQIRLPDEEPAYRFLAACRTPDAILFQRTTDQKVLPRRSLPTGLEVCVALGSKPAADLLVEDPDRDRVLEIIRETRPAFAGRTLYAAYLNCLSALLEPPDARVPAFMRTDVWQRKNLQTALAGWAQLRHTFTLQIKATTRVFGGAAKLAGFVEPVPGFFARLRNLVHRTRALVETAGVIRVGPEDRARQIRRVVTYLRACGFERKGWKACEALTRVQYLQVLQVSDFTWGRRWKSGKKELLGWLEHLASALAKGDRRDEIVPTWMFDTREVNPGTRWKRLEDLAGRLERLARKQLAGEGFDAGESKEILAFGSDLAAVMGYSGSLTLFPCDDAPRITDVYCDPTRLLVLRHVLAGIARPRALYVLYPWKGGEVLCRGAVLPYYELTRSERLDDLAWHRLLDGVERPPQPAWIDPLAGKAGLSRPTWETSNR